MVKITAISLRINKDGKEFYSLILSGGISMVKSKVTDRYYATLSKASVTSTFDEQTARAMIGEQIPGSIQKQSCDPYSFVIKDTGEIVELNYRFVYLPEGDTIESVIYEEMPAEMSSKQPIFLRQAS